MPRSDPGAGPAVRVRAGSRLHFGLLDVSGASGRRFGGAGVMLEEPSLEIAAVPSPEPRAEGPLAERARRALERLGAGGPGGASAWVTVVRAPPQHVGLGTGTQLDLSVATALTRLQGREGGACDLARRLGRGERSAIGVHGFRAGGFLADGGRRGGRLAPLVVRVPVPPEWRFLAVIPAGVQGISGRAEREAFSRSGRLRPEEVDILCRLLLLGLVPALLEADVESFAAALGEYGRRASEPFRDLQGGTYAHGATRRVIEFLRAEGLEGCGQSSWGPTCYAVCGDEERAADAARRLEARFGLGPGEVWVSAARSCGALVEVLGFS